MSGEVLQVYYNIRRKCFSVRDKQTKKVIDHTDRILLHNCSFIVHEAGRQRVLQTKHKNVHAWIEGFGVAWKSRDTGKGSLPLGIWSRKELCLREVTYNPYKYNQFVRRDKTFEPVVVADMVYLSSENGRCEVQAYNKDMWGEFSEDEGYAYDEIDWKTQSIFIARGAPEMTLYISLSNKGILNYRPFVNNRIHGYLFTLL